MSSKIILKNTNSSATIVQGELTSFKKNDLEFIHQKGNKGWRKSDDEMFPVIGSTSKNNFRVHTKNGDAVLDQHGLLRELEYNLISSDKTSAYFSKKYSKNTPVKNSKFPEKSSEEHLSWPFDFSFQKNFSLEKEYLKIDFIVDSEPKMPFMLGYHPAFLLSDSGNEVILSSSEKITLDTVLKAGANAFPIPNSDKLVLKNSDKNDLEISTKGFNNFMLWTEVNNMICIEPVTHYPSYKNHSYSEKNMRISGGKEKFSVILKVL